MVGYEAGVNNTGSNNVFLGKATGKGAGSGSQVIAIGQGVMETASQIDNSVLIGNYMAANCTSGAGSTVAIGANCLSVSGYSGEGNVAIGHQAGNNLSSGDDNVLIGKNAGDALTTAGNNVAIGAEAGRRISTGANNTCIGGSAGAYATTTSNNTFVGYQAGQGKTSGTVSGANNVAIGEDCFTTLKSASNNVVIGYRCLGGAGEQDGDNNVFIGQSIYANAYFTGNNSIAIGSMANPSAQNVSNEITLGNNSIATLRCQQTSITSLSDQRDEQQTTGIDILDKEISNTLTYRQHKIIIRSTPHSVSTVIPTIFLFAHP